MGDEVAELLAAARHPQEPAIRALRGIILGVDPRIREDIKWNAPSYFTTQHFATFHLRTKSGIAVILHLGAKPRPDATVRNDVADPLGLLDWRGTDRAVVTFANLADVEAKGSAFGELLRQWVTHVR